MFHPQIQQESNQQRLLQENFYTTLSEKLSCLKKKLPLKVQTLYQNFGQAIYVEKSFLMNIYLQYSGVDSMFEHQVESRQSLPINQYVEEFENKFFYALEANQQQDTFILISFEDLKLIFSYWLQHQIGVEVKDELTFLKKFLNANVFENQENQQNYNLQIQYSKWLSQLQARSSSAIKTNKINLNLKDHLQFCQKYKIQNFYLSFKKNYENDVVFKNDNEGTKKQEFWIQFQNLLEKLPKQNNYIGFCVNQNQEVEESLLHDEDIHEQNRTNGEEEVYPEVENYKGEENYKDRNCIKAFDVAMQTQEFEEFFGDQEKIQQFKQYRHHCERFVYVEKKWLWSILTLLGMRDYLEYRKTAALFDYKQERQANQTANQKKEKKLNKEKQKQMTQLDEKIIEPQNNTKVQKSLMREFETVFKYLPKNDGEDRILMSFVDLQQLFQFWNLEQKQKLSLQEQVKQFLMDNMIFDPFYNEKLKILSLNQEKMAFFDLKNSQLYSYFNQCWKEPIEPIDLENILNQISWNQGVFEKLVLQSNKQAKKQFSYIKMCFSIFKYQLEFFTTKNRQLKNCPGMNKFQEFLDQQVKNIEKSNQEALNINDFKQLFFWLTNNFSKLIKAKETFDLIMELESPTPLPRKKIFFFKHYKNYCLQYGCDQLESSRVYLEKCEEQQNIEIKQLSIQVDQCETEKIEQNQNKSSMIQNVEQNKPKFKFRFSNPRNYQQTYDMIRKIQFLYKEQQKNNNPT